MRQNQNIYSASHSGVTRISEFYFQVSQMIPKLWRLKIEEVWTYAISPNPNLTPAQGWKIHISAIPVDAVKILKTVSKICFERDVEFKFNSDFTVLKKVLSKACPRGSSGKFITIYPKDKIEFLLLLEDLYDALKNEKGPYILSDRRYKDSSTVYYRYGGIYPFERLKLDGNRQYDILDDNYRFTPDERGPYFNLPEWIKDIQEDENRNDEDANFCHDKYKIISVIRFSNTGGVYRGLNNQNQATVLIKEARPFIEITTAGVDAVSRLKKEFRVLGQLAGSGIAPIPFDYFEEWEHVYLAQELIPGVDLKKYNAQNNKLIKRNSSHAELCLWFEKVVRISKNVIRALMKLHSHNIIFGDLSPGNIIVDPETLNIKFVDFEGSSEVGIDPPDNVLTPGFASKERDARAYIRFTDDHYALGCVMAFLLLPITQLSDIEPLKISDFLHEIQTDIGLPAEFIEVIQELISEEPKSLEHYQKILEGASMDLLKSRTRKKLGISRSILKRMINKTVESILFITDQGREIGSPEVEASWGSSLTVDNGIMGVAYALHTINGYIPRSMDRRIFRGLNSGGHLPGLYNGLSGIAWTLMKLGYKEEAELSILNAKTHRLLYQDMSLGIGASGYGLTNLFFWKETNKDIYLKEAIKIADILVELKKEDQNGYYWSNSPEGEHDIGYYAGSAGISLFLLYMYCVVKNVKYLRLGEGGLAFDLKQGRNEEAGGPVGYPASTKNNSILYPYLNYGSAGVGSALLRYFYITRNCEYLKTIEEIKLATSQKYAVFPGLFTGLSGLGNYLLDAATFLEDDSYIGLAREAAQGVCLFSISRAYGISFPGDGLRNLCLNYSMGASGIVLFLHRLKMGGPNFNFTLDELLYNN